ncbi:MAG: RidA family protein [Spirochaetaceae bacterium]
MAGTPFSPSLRAGSFVFVSGKIGMDADSGGIPPGDVTAQTRQTLENIGKELAKQNLSLENVVKTTVFITDMRNYAAMNEEYVKHFPSKLPARSCVAVSSLPRVEALVEIEAVAYTE